MKGYVWYSAGSDKTGPELAAALGFESGSKTPKIENYEIVIGWGAKPGTTYNQANFKKAIASGKLRILNPVEAIVENRNKLTTLKKLEAAGVMTPGLVARTATFVADVKKAINDGKVAFPLLGLTAENKGGPTFIYTAEDLERIPADVAYVRTFIPGTEYRVHVMRNMVLLAQKKQLAQDPVKACAAELTERLQTRGEKDPKVKALLPHFNNPGLLRTILEELAGELFSSPNQILRSVSQGWELVDAPLANVPEKVKAEAIRALEAAGLDLGAVSVTLDEGNKHARATVTVITTGPSLTPAHLNTYTQVLKDFAAGGQVKDEAPAAKKAVAERAAPTELTAKLQTRIGSLTEKEAKRLLAYLEA